MVEWCIVCQGGVLCIMAVYCVLWLVYCILVNRLPVDSGPSPIIR